MVDTSNPPVLDAYESEHQYHVWCQYCRVWHHHGREDGHRVAHCYWPLSPYEQTGYFVRRVGAWKDRPKYKSRPWTWHQQARARMIAGVVPHRGRAVSNGTDLNALYRELQIQAIT